MVKLDNAASNGAGCVLTRPNNFSGKADAGNRRFQLPEATPLHWDLRCNRDNHRKRTLLHSSALSHYVKAVVEERAYEGAIIDNVATTSLARIVSYVMIKISSLRPNTSKLSKRSSSAKIMNVYI